MDDNEANAKKAMKVASSFLCGSLVLILCSFLQKIIAGFDPFLLKGYIVPLFFGGIVGGLLGTKCQKVMMLNKALATRNKELEGAVGSILPICSHCKAIREPGKNPKDKKSWQPVESFLFENTTSRFTHSICPNCVEEIYPEIYASKYLGSESE